MVRAFTLTERQDLGSGIAALSLQQRQCNDVNMGSSEWRNSEISELLTFTAEELMQSHLTKTGKTVGSTRKYQRNFPYKVFVGIKDRQGSEIAGCAKPRPKLQCRNA
ncbi:unnamed protein product [Boreogadus saida]